MLGKVYLSDEESSFARKPLIMQVINPCLVFDIFYFLDNIGKTWAIFLVEPHVFG